jgi:cystathionine gamma-synthase
LEYFKNMEKHPTGIKWDSWLVSAGRPCEAGAPLNVPLIPASNFIIGGGREYSRDDGTPTWEALEEVGF